MTIPSPADTRWMEAAIAQARVAEQQGDVPIGALVVYGDQPIAQAENRTERLKDPTAHAEVLAIREAAAARDSWRLSGCTLYVTLEPCAMCAGAILHARLARLVYGARDPKTGACGSVIDVTGEPRLNHHTRVTGGIAAQGCGELLTQFFAARRQKAVLG